MNFRVGDRVKVIKSFITEYNLSYYERNGNIQREKWYSEYVVKDTYPYITLDGFPIQVHNSILELVENRKISHNYKICDCGTLTKNNKCCDCEIR